MKRWGMTSRRNIPPISWPWCSGRSGSGGRRRNSPAKSSERSPAIRPTRMSGPGGSITARYQKRIGSRSAAGSTRFSTIRPAATACRSPASRSICRPSRSGCTGFSRKTAGGCCSPRPKTICSAAAMARPRPLSSSCAKKVGASSGSSGSNSRASCSRARRCTMFSGPWPAGCGCSASSCSGNTGPTPSSYLMRPSTIAIDSSSGISGRSIDQMRE